MNTFEADTFLAAAEPDIDPRLLRAFLAVAREGHFGHAAAGLGIAQPALSRQVRRLERLLEAQLFVRTPRGAELTVAGRTVIPAAEHVLALNQRVVQVARSAAGTEAGVLTVSAPMPSPPGGLLAEAVRRLRRDHAHVRVSVVELRDGQQATALAEGRVDAVLTWEAPTADGLSAEALLEERTSALLAQGHPRADADVLTLGELGTQSVLFPVAERSHCWEQLDVAATAEGVEFSTIPTAPAAVLGLVAAGLGVSAVPDSFRLAGHPGVRLVPLERLSGTMSVVWRHDDEAPAVAAFVAACRDAAGFLAAAHADVWRPARSAGSPAHPQDARPEPVV